MTQEAFLNMAVRLTLVYAAIFCGAIVAAAALTPGLVAGENGVVGGDFLAFYTAGDFAKGGHALAAYDFAAFDAALKARAPLDHLGLLWQYPPAVFFLTAPFALIPYKLSYFVWIGAGWTALLAALRNIGFRGPGFWLLGFSPLCVNVVDNGQISLLTAALLSLSVYDPKNRWLVAGIAAGILTIKPQLGILLPIVFLCSGAWRTIAVASAIAIVIHGTSHLVFGAEGWRDFFMAVQRLKADVTGPGHFAPPQGMATLFGQLRVLGFPTEVALPVQYGLSLTIVGLVAIVWRRPGDVLGKAALACAGAVFAAPYAYGYETASLLLPAAYIASQARDYRSPEALYFIGAAAMIMVAPALPLPSAFQLWFLISASAFAMVLYVMMREARTSAFGGAVRA